jgi:hypothetical protein
MTLDIVDGEVAFNKVTPRGVVLDSVLPADNITDHLLPRASIAMAKYYRDGRETIASQFEAEFIGIVKCLHERYPALEPFQLSWCAQELAQARHMGTWKKYQKIPVYLRAKIDREVLPGPATSVDPPTETGQKSRKKPRGKKPKVAKPTSAPTPSIEVKPKTALDQKLADFGKKGLAGNNQLAAKAYLLKLAETKLRQAAVEKKMAARGLAPIVEEETLPLPLQNHEEQDSASEEATSLPLPPSDDEDFTHFADAGPWRARKREQER